MTLDKIFIGYVLNLKCTRCPLVLDIYMDLKDISLNISLNIRFWQIKMYSFKMEHPVLITIL